MKTKIFPSFLIMFFALVFNVQSAEAEPIKKEYMFPDKTLYIDEDVTYFTEEMQATIEKYWGLMPIKYLRKEQALGQLNNSNSFVLTQLKVRGDQTDFNPIVILGGKDGLVNPESKLFLLSTYYLCNYIDFKIYVGPLSKLKSTMNYNYASFLPLFIKNCEYVLFFTLREKSNQLLKFDSDWMPEVGIIDNNSGKSISVLDKEIFILNEHLDLDNPFDFAQFCAYNKLDPSKVKLVNNEEFAKLIASNQKIILGMANHSNSIDFYQNDQGTKISTTTQIIISKKERNKSFIGMVALGALALIIGIVATKLS